MKPGKPTMTASDASEDDLRVVSVRLRRSWGILAHFFQAEDHR